jgi:hypothetical protein
MITINVQCILIQHIIIYPNSNQLWQHSDIQDIRTDILFGIIVDHHITSV